MESHTIRVSKKTLSTIRQLAEKNEKTMTAIVEEAVREFEIKKYWEEYYADYAALKANPEAWADFQEELSAWDCTLADGLKDLPYEQDDSAPTPSPRRSVDRRSGSARRS
jgi:predicted transcriptional regulator